MRASRNMPPRPAASPDDIQISSVFDALKKSARTIALVSIALGGLTFATLAMMAPKYQSQAELAIIARGAAAGFNDPRSTNGPDLITTRMDKEAINTHVRSLQSPDLLEKIAEELKLKNDAEFNNALGPVDSIDAALRLVGIGGPRRGETDRDRVLSAFRNQLEVYSAKESRFIGIRMTSIDPDLAARVANTLAEKYRATLAEQGVEEIDDQQKVIQQKLEKLGPELEAAETEVDRYRGQIDGFKGGAQNTGLNEQQMGDLTAELSKAKAARGEADARAKSAREMMKLGSADALPDVQKSPLIQNLVQQRIRIERQISELSATLLPGHPRMQQLNADLAGLKKQLNGEIAKVVESLEKEAKVAQGREDSISKSLADIKTRVVTNAPEEAKLRQLEAYAKAKRVELENLQAQLEANRKKLDTRAQPVEAQIISRAQAASVPVFPKKIPLSGLIAVASMMFGAAWVVTKALFIGARGGTPLQQAPVNQRALRAEPVLARVGAQRGYANNAPDAIAEEAGPDASYQAIPAPGSQESQPGRREPVTATIEEGTISGIAARLRSKPSPEGGHRTLITGETSAVDASGEAIELARSMANTGVQVILVDWSPAGNGLARSAGIEAKPGLNDLLAGEGSFEQIIQRLPGGSAHCIAAGSISYSAIDADQINLVLDALDEAYDYIVVTGRHDEARELFETIEGRFDAGITVAEQRARIPVLGDPAGTFLGFEVADIDVMRFERKATQPQPNQRIARAAQRSAPIARF